MTCEHSLKTWSRFRMFSYKKVVVVKVMEWRRFCFDLRNIVTSHSFYEWQKALVKTWNKIFHSFRSKLVLLKASVKQMTKAALALGLGKSIFVRYLEWTHNCIKRLITRYNAIFYSRIRIDIEFKDEYGTSLVYVNHV